MKPTNDFLHAADKHIRKTLLELRPKLLEAQGSIEHKLKDDKSVVTEMDLLVENHLKEALHELSPAIGFGGEETGVDYDQKTFWLVDPIDGTESFIRGMPFCTNMIALIHGGQVLMSVIYNFTLDEYFLAIKGQGATCNGHAISVSDRVLSRGFVVLTGRIGDKGNGLADRLRGRCRGIFKVNASGYEYCMLARGAIDGLAGPVNGKPWDHAPGSLLVQEAGGRIANVGTDTYDYRNTNVVASNGIAFDELMHFMADNQ